MNGTEGMHLYLIRGENFRNELFSRSKSTAKHVLIWVSIRSYDSFSIRLSGTYDRFLFSRPSISNIGALVHISISHRLSTDLYK